MDSDPVPPHKRPNKGSHRPPHGIKSHPKADPVNPLKSRLRSITRLLSHKSSTMPADKLLALQREEASIRAEIASIESKEKRSRMIAKYHRVRFFERRKAERRLKQAQRNLGRCESEAEEGGGGGESGQNIAAFQEEVRCCRVDLNYTLYYPLTKRYMSLFTKSENGEERVTRDKDMWSIVQDAMTQNKLEELRDGRWKPWEDEEEIKADNKRKTISTMRRTSAKNSVAIHEQLRQRGSQSKPRLDQINKGDKGAANVGMSNTYGEESGDDDGMNFFENG